MLPTIYLTGDVRKARDYLEELPKSLNDWRTVALTRLQKHGLTVVNPVEIAWRERDDFEAIQIDDFQDKQVRRALDLIDESDALLANVEKSNYGTAMEIFYAHRRGKMVTVVGSSPFNPWILSHSQAHFEDVNRAVDYIIEENPQLAPLTWSLQYEAQLSERYEQMPPCGEPDYKFLGGNLPVLAVAPHATAYWQEGEFHEQDSFTGSLASVLNRLSGCHAMLSNYCSMADTCWYLETPFRRALSDIIRSGKVGMVLLLLGSTWHEAPGLQVSVYGDDEEDNQLNIYRKQLHEKLSDLEPVSRGAYDKRIRPLARFIAEELKIPCVVLRLHKRYRMPRLQPIQYTRLANLLAEFVHETGSELLRSQN